MILQQHRYLGINLNIVKASKAQFKPLIRSRGESLAQSPGAARVLVRQRVRSRLEEHLRGLPEGTRLPPVKQLAVDLGVGQSSLHQVLRELAGEGWVTSRQRMGTFVARTSAQRTGGPLEAGHLAGRIIGLVFPRPVDDLVLEMVEHARQALADGGAIPRPLLPTDMSSFAQVVEPGDCDGYILFNPSPTLRLTPTDQRRVVVISTSWHASTVAPLRVDLVGLDQHGGACLAGAHLRAAGVQRVCYLGNRRPQWAGAYDPVSQLRLTGFAAGWGAPVPLEHQLDAEGYSFDAGGRAFRRWRELGQGPDGLFAASDEIAVGFVAAAVAHQLVPGLDFQLVGFDGQAAATRLPDGGLTTIAAPVRAMGREAVLALSRRLRAPDRPQQVSYLGCHLRQGGSTHPTPGSPPGSLPGSSPGSSLGSSLGSTPGNSY